MKTKHQTMCIATWMDSRGAGCAAQFTAEELEQFTMKRYKRREACTVYLIGDNGRADEENPVAWVWKANEWNKGYWRWCIDSTL